MKLNLGAGDVPLDGYLNLDRKTGGEAFPLPYDDNSVEEIRASHVLEHFPHGQVTAVIAEWVRVLKPGGRLRIAVPNFGQIARAYADGQAINAQGFLMGGQLDQDDYHKALFDEGSLKRVMAEAGLCLIRPWLSECGDAASLAISLNLAGMKPHKSAVKIRAVMSAPRLGFLDMMFSAMEALPPLGIPFFKVGGAFWGQSLTLGIEQQLEADPDCDYILALDYDSIFNASHMATLAELAMVYPEWDAIAPLQANRHMDAPLFTMNSKGDSDGLVTVGREYFCPELKGVPTAHFGLTLLKADALRSLPKPWFHSVPDRQGGWGDGKTDDDIHFWRIWARAGRSLALATRVQIGHAQLMVRWLDQDMKPIWQTAEDWNASKRPPASAWKEA
jgi:hypothetical protein